MLLAGNCFKFGLWCHFRSSELLRKEFDFSCFCLFPFPVSWCFPLSTPNPHVTGVKGIAKVIWLQFTLLEKWLILAQSLVIVYHMPSETPAVVQEGDWWGREVRSPFLLRSPALSWLSAPAWAGTCPLLKNGCDEAGNHNQGRRKGRIAPWAWLWWFKDWKVRNINKKFYVKTGRT